MSLLPISATAAAAISKLHLHQMNSHNLSGAKDCESLTNKPAGSVVASLELLITQLIELQSRILNTYSVNGSNPFAVNFVTFEFPEKIT